MPASKSAKPVQPASKAVAKTEKKAPSVSAPKSKATLLKEAADALLAAAEAPAKKKAGRPAKAAADESAAPAKATTGANTMQQQAAGGGRGDGKWQSASGFTTEIQLSNISPLSPLRKRSGTAVKNSGTRFTVFFFIFFKRTNSRSPSNKSPCRRGTAGGTMD